MSHQRKRKRRLAAAKSVQSMFQRSAPSSSSSEASTTSATIVRTPSGRVSMAQPKPEIKVQPGAGGPIREGGLREADVLCGRGAFLMGHPGNRRYRKLVREMRDRYLDPSVRKLQKAFVAAELIDAIRTKYGGRFLSKSKTDGCWYELGDAKALKKTGQAMRDNENEDYDAEEESVARAAKPKAKGKTKNKSTEKTTKKQAKSDSPKQKVEATGKTTGLDERSVELVASHPVRGEQINHLDHSENDEMECGSVHGDSLLRHRGISENVRTQSVASSSAPWYDRRNQYDFDRSIQDWHSNVSKSSPSTTDARRSDYPEERIHHHIHHHFLYQNQPPKPQDGYRPDHHTIQSFPIPHMPALQTSSSPAMAVGHQPTDRDDMLFGQPFTHPRSSCSGSSGNCSSLSTPPQSAKAAR